MDPRTIGQILSNPDWLRQTYGEERTIQQQPLPPGGSATYIPAYGDLAPASMTHDYPQPPLQAQQPVPVRPESRPIEVRGQIAYVARFRAEYFNPADQPTMMTLAQAVIMNQTGTEPGETPPPWFPDVQFWIQSFEVIDPYATAQQAELERLHAAKLEQDALIRIREAERAEQLRRERMLYGEPGTYSRANEPARRLPLRGGDSENGWGPGPIPGSAGPDWVGDVFREIFGRLDAIGDRLDAMAGGDHGAAGAGAALHPDADRPGAPDRAGRDGADAGAARRDPEERVVVEAHVEEAAEQPRDMPSGAVGDPLPEPGGEARSADPGPRVDRARRKAALESA